MLSNYRSQFNVSLEIESLGVCVLPRRPEKAAASVIFLPAP